jgi:hypothetical protein
MMALAGACALAQSNASGPQVLRGTYLEGDAKAEGELSVRDSDSEVFLYRFDRRTKVTRTGAVTTIELLRPGERVEISSDEIADSPIRYARAVTAVDPLPPYHAPTRVHTSLLTPPPLPLFARADLTFSGVVKFLADGRMILRTRNSVEETILLRGDTRFLDDGDIVKQSDLKANMRVFVRAGKDLFGHTEAYQVMWGKFLQPR